MRLRLLHNLKLKACCKSLFLIGGDFCWVHLQPADPAPPLSVYVSYKSWITQINFRIRYKCIQGTQTLKQQHKIYPGFNSDSEHNNAV